MMTSAIDKTFKTCLYADVIEMIYYLWVSGWMTCTGEAREKFDENCEKQKTSLADKIDFIV